MPEDRFSLTEPLHPWPSIPEPPDPRAQSVLDPTGGLSPIADASVKVEPGRRTVPFIALVAVVVVLILVVAGAGVLVVTQRDTESRLRATGRGLQRDLGTSRAQVAADAAQIDRQASTISGLNAEISNLTSQLDDAKQRANASAQLSRQVASVADSLKNCVDANSQFERDFSIELGTNTFSNFVTQEATNAQAACTQANVDYQALLAELKLAGVGVTA